MKSPLIAITAALLMLGASSAASAGVMQVSSFAEK